MFHLLFLYVSNVLSTNLIVKETSFKALIDKLNNQPDLVANKT